MANTFKRKTQRGIGTTLTQINTYVVPAATTTTVIGLICSNTSAADVNIDVAHYDGTNSTYLVKNAPVQPGSALVAVGGSQKVVLQTGDSIQVKSSAATSVDVVMSILEIT